MQVSSEARDVRFPGTGITAVVNRLVWVLGTKFLPSRRAASALKC